MVAISAKAARTECVPNKYLGILPRGHIPGFLQKFGRRVDRALELCKRHGPEGVGIIAEVGRVLCTIENESDIKT